MSVSIGDMVETCKLAAPAAMKRGYTNSQAFKWSTATLVRGQTALSMFRRAFGSRSGCGDAAICRGCSQKLQSVDASGYIEPPSPVEAANAISLWAKEIGARASKENDLIEEASHWPSCERGALIGPSCEPMTCSFEGCDTEAYESMTCSLKL